MPLTLIKETGAGLDDANTYASREDGDAYHEASLYAPEWASATPERKERALASATRLLDGEMQFNGYKRRQEQSLQWPRRLCPDPDSDSYSVWLALGGAVSNPTHAGSYLPEDKVPKPVVDAACELAGRMLQTNRAADPREASVGSGVKRFELHEAIEVEFNTSQSSDEVFVTPTLPRDVSNLLSKYGRAVGDSSGVVPLIRA